MDVALVAAAVDDSILRGRKGALRARGKRQQAACRKGGGLPCRRGGSSPLVTDFPPTPVEAAEATLLSVGTSQRVSLLP